MLKLSGISLRRLVLLSCALLACPCVVAAAPGACVENPAGVFTCSGDHAQGIASGTDYGSPPAHTLIVDGLSGAITPSAGQSGIDFRNSAGGNVTIKSGTAQQGVVITTQGTNAAGIKALGTGAPSGYTLLPGLGIRVPAGSSGAGGPVAVESHGTITTHGAQSHGISAQNAIGTYDPAVVASLQAFSASDVTTALDTVEGVADNIGRPVAGDRGGLFTLAEGGGWHFDADTLADTLEAGESVITTLHYEVLLTSASGTTRSEGALAVLVHKVDDDTLTTTPAVYFNDFNVYSDPNGATPLWPNLQGYVDNLLADMGIAGAGESVAVVNHGNITTAGAAAHGIVGRADGGKGANGTSGSFWNAWLVPEAGGRGANGGAVHLVHDGSMQTAGTGAHGVVAESRGGGGGTGGHGSLWHPNGAQGGTGGTGGAITVTGAGAIRTDGHGAVGILAQSSGGAGGAGGAADTVGIGGAGGFAGRGGSVDIQGNWAITTTGDLAHGIWGKSLGGSAGPGGSGGWLISQPGAGGEASDGGLVSIASGGAVSTLGDHAYGLYAQSIGGAGGAGGAVSVINRGEIRTHGGDARGVFAQSIGGGGGDTGASTWGLISIGGLGDVASHGGSVTVANSGVIATQGAGADAVFAESIGGGGGTGTSNVGAISVGGFGTGGGHGGSVHVSQSGTIRTEGELSRGIFAHSIGGGGGAGKGAFGVVAVGGSGAGSGSGGTVSVANDGAIATRGAFSDGIFAQSVGGGGGTGAAERLENIASGLVSIGGSGSGGGAGGDVTVDNTGDIDTAGAYAKGIHAQSVGAGGGSANATVSNILTVGGTGGAAGAGGAVSVTHSGRITTQGAGAHGIDAQSVGGGGGTSGHGFYIAVNVGGSGGASGDGGDVMVDATGLIATKGNAARGISAQSVGGSGGSHLTDDGALDWQNISFDAGLLVSIGSGAAGSGHGGNVTADKNGDIFTEGDDADGIFAQSVGGGGGTGSIIIGAAAVEVDWTIGSQSMGRGGDVTVANHGGIATLGDGARGVFAQSIGGGGGDGRFSLGVLSLSHDALVGSRGGGQGGAVSVAKSGVISTQGIDAQGILAQSVGGSGGVGTSVLTGSMGFQLGTAMSIGGAGGDGGIGGAVSVANNGAILTLGELSDGIFAQSIGGGGGRGGTSMAVSAVLSLIDFYSLNHTVSLGGGGGGRGGAVSVHNSGLIATEGANARGVFAQSVGGGGGHGGQSLNGSLSVNTSFHNNTGIGGTGGEGGDGHTVHVSSEGTVATLGDRAEGLFAQSVGGGGGAGGTSALIRMEQSIGLPSIPGTDQIPTLDLEGTLSSSIGGSGGNGGTGGAVVVENEGLLTTAGDFSSGLFAQSVGGGGGAGGASIRVDSSVSLLSAEIPTEWKDLIGLPSVSLSVTSSVGGSGGAGGVGGTLSVANGGTIVITGANAAGLFAQSVGGGGGAGGHSFTVKNEQNIAGATVNLAPAVEVTSISSIGGAGGGGGTGGAVTAANTGQIHTTGNLSAGLLAQSVGGGGGTGGTSMMVSREEDILDLNIAPAVKVDIRSSIGGSGAAGGVGGTVEVHNGGWIETEGAGAAGIFAQSVGGGGGAGGASITAETAQSLLQSSPPAFGVKYEESIGGAAGAGALGGIVSVSGPGDIVTRGDRAIGVFAQSVGGGGGAGGASIAGATKQTLLTATLASGEIEVASTIGGTGGTGGTGGNGGAVTVDGGARIATLGDLSHGILAQSVGGGGGAGGAVMSAGTGQGLLDIAPLQLKIGYAATVGGSAAAGGTGGAVTVTGDTHIHTQGDMSHGIFAQSVGGGGGAGGAILKSSTTQTLLSAAAPSAGVEIASVIGGTGGAGGAGGAVAATFADRIITEGSLSHGVLAQSIGGGGGAGGACVNLQHTQQLLTNAPAKAEMGYASILGGSGGAGGTGGDVAVAQDGLLVTRGDSATGLFAQSVGGGGGNGAEVIALNIEQSILTASAGEQLVLELGHDTKLGGDGSGGGAGGAVSVGNTGGIATAGHAAKGLVAQSVGGGGGRAGAIVSAEVKTAYLDAVSSRALKAAFAASIGGSGGAGGDGGAVEVVNEGAVQTLGRAASALVAQSVGGGGGLAEYQVVIDMDIEDIPADGMLNPADLQMVFSDTPGSAGNGGAVSVQNRGDILTEGAFSSGIIAQSVGGGGGLVEMLNAQGRITTDIGASMQGMLLSNASGLFFAGSVGGNGSGGAVIVENSGDIMVLGDHAYGIFAQSAGGAGAGAVQVTAGGNIVAPGVDASAILAQSAGGAGNGDITVTITDGIIMGGTGQGAGVSIQGGASNTLTNHGAIGSIEGLQGRAICGTDGDETLYNFGTIEGAIDLGSGVNTFWNAADGLYASGAAVTLGDGNRMVNAGVVSPGGLAAYQHTELTGDYTQTATGHLEVQIDHDGRHDRLAVNGGEASLDGSLSVLRDTGQAFQNGTVYTLLTAGHIDGVFSMIDLPEARPMLRFVYNQTTEAIEIRAIVPSAVTVASNRSAVAIGRYLDTILPGATGDLSYVLDLFQNLSLSQFDQAFESLSPAAFDNLTQVSHIGLRHYAHSLHQRMALVRSYANTHAPAALNRPVLLAMADTGDSAMPLPYLGRSMKSVRPPSLWISGRRHWGQAEAQPRTGFAGYDYRISAGAIGLDLTFAENGMLGLSINKGRAKVELERHQGEGKMESLTGALYGGLFSRNAYLEGSLAYGVNHYRNQRHLTIGPEQRTAYSEHKADVYPAHLAGGYLFNLRGLFLGPAVSLRYTYLKETPFTETGADSLNLKVDGRNTKSLVAEAGLRGAYLVDTSVGRIMPEIGAALIYDFDIDDRVITAAFDGSPDHVFSMPGRDVEQFGLAVDAGLTYVTPCGISTAVKYQGEFRNRFQSHGIMGELRFQF